MIDQLSIAIAIKEVQLHSSRTRAGARAHARVAAIFSAKTEAGNSEFSVYDPLHSFK